MVRNIFFLCIVIFLVVMQYHATLSIAGIIPNTLIVVALATALGKSRPWMLMSILVVIIGGGLLFSTFWLLELIVLVAVVIAAKLFMRPIIGNAYLDFLIVVTVATIVFALLVRIPLGIPINAWSLIGEIIYNGVVALLVWPLAQRLIQKHTT